MGQVYSTKKVNKMGEAKFYETETTASDATPVRFVYDKEADILEIFFGESKGSDPRGAGFWLATPEIMPYGKLRIPYVTISFVPYAISCIFLKDMSYGTKTGGCLRLNIRTIGEVCFLFRTW